MYVTEVIADEVNFLEKKDSSQENSHTTNENSNEDITPVDDGDIPF